MHSRSSLTTAGSGEHNSYPARFGQGFRSLSGKVNDILHSARFCRVERTSNAISLALKLTFGLCGILAESGMFSLEKRGAGSRHLSFSRIWQPMV